MADSLIKLFSEVFDIPAEKLSEESSSQNTSQWDSLAAMHLVAAIEDRYAITLSTKDIVRMTTIGAARQVLTGKNVAF